MATTTSAASSTNGIGRSLRLITASNKNNISGGGDVNLATAMSTENPIMLTTQQHHDV